MAASPAYFRFQRSEELYVRLCNRVRLARWAELTGAQALIRARHGLRISRRAAKTPERDMFVCSSDGTAMPIATPGANSRGHPRPEITAEAACGSFSGHRRRDFLYFVPDSAVENPA
jgi:hypothetical protein